jgi:hypothetical protein
MLSKFISLNRKEIVARCRAEAAQAMFPPRGRGERDGLLLVLGQLIEAMGPTPSTDLARAAEATEHGMELHRRGFTVGQVVHYYASVWQSVTALAAERKASIASDEFQTLSRCLEGSIADAVTGFVRLSDRQFSTREDLRLAVLTVELKTLVGTASLAFDSLKTGAVGIEGSTGALLDRSLKGLRILSDQSLADLSATARTRRPRTVASQSNHHERG